MNFRTRLVAAALLAFAASLIPRTAQAADPAKVEQLLTVMKVDRQLEKMKDLLVQGMERGFVDAARKRGMTQAEIDRGRPLLDQIKKSVDEMFSMEFLKPQIVKIYGEELTNEEVDAALVYYSSPQGQSLLAKLPVIMQRGGDVGMKRAQEMGPKIDEEINAALDKMHQDEAKDARKTADAAMEQVHDAEAKDAAATDQNVAKPEATSDKPDPQH